ncbi:MAG: hypothetical protein FWC23_05730 [Chitinispirillia bacterium]|nr:hypothetical protein [Chitinispirillia bacterium]MCL2268667.1 hypothetical protein [Chitinispirillia bacterium]
MERRYAEEFFPKNFAKIERRRAETLENGLNSDQIASLLSMRFNREPLYKSVEEFYTPDYLKALSDGLPAAELAKVHRYRQPTEKEVNMLFSDIHSKEKMYEATGGQPST